MQEPEPGKRVRGLLMRGYCAPAWGASADPEIAQNGNHDHNRADNPNYLIHSSLHSTTPERSLSLKSSPRAGFISNAKPAALWSDRLSEREPVSAFARTASNYHRRPTDMKKTGRLTGRPVLKRDSGEKSMMHRSNALVRIGFRQILDPSRDGQFCSQREKERSFGALRGVRSRLQRRAFERQPGTPQGVFQFFNLDNEMS